VPSTLADALSPPGARRADDRLSSRRSQSEKGRAQRPVFFISGIVDPVLDGLEKAGVCPY
jgi:hypothetical protein